MGFALPLAIAVLLGGVLGALSPPGLFAAIALALLMNLARARFVTALLLLTLSLSAAQVLMARGAVLPSGLSGVDLAVSGKITELSDEGRFKRLRLTVEACQPLESQQLDCDRLGLVRVNWYRAPPLVVGERWSLTLRLRVPHGFANPDTFDYGAWLWREGIDATGYVSESPAPRRLAPSPGSIRQRALAFLDSHVEDDLTRRWLAALTLGAGQRLTDDDWDLFNATGTTHLMVISGLHIGLAAAFVLWLSRGLARLTTPRQWRMVTWPWWCAAAAAAGYAWLSGLEPPAMRSMIMTLMAMWVASGRHAPGPWQGWWLALAIVVLIDPLALWQPGLWLSFVAVALLILIWQGRKRPRGVRGWLGALLRTQCLLAPLMAGAVLLAFDRVAPVSPLVNLLAVPVVGSVMVPLGLVGWLLAWAPPLMELCWMLFGALAHWVHAGLVASASWLPVWQPQPWQLMPLVLILGLLSALWALPGLAKAPRWVGSVALILSGMTLTPPVMSEGQLRVRVHDVGQGQLIELRTAHHRLLYDSGPRFGSGFMPLVTLWPKGQHFDGVIISHSDNDHAGGIEALRDEHEVARWWTPGVDELGVDDTACRAGQHWQWDGVEFRFLWPVDEPSALASNDRSCVLLVEVDDQRLLISGDAGADIESQLLTSLPDDVTLLVAGHHGSHTSSSAAWVAATNPQHVLFSAGRDNSHGHPHDDVVRRFREAGSCLWNTAIDGALTLWLGKVQVSEVTTQRLLPGRGVGVGVGCHAVESPR